jgi:hypothetical protein
MILSDLKGRFAWFRQVIQFGLRGGIFLDLLEMRKRIYENMKAFSSYKGHLYSSTYFLRPECRFRLLIKGRSGEAEAEKLS